MWMSDDSPLDAKGHPIPHWFLLLSYLFSLSRRCTLQKIHCLVQGHEWSSLFCRVNWVQRLLQKGFLSLQALINSIYDLRCLMFSGWFSIWGPWAPGELPHFNSLAKITRLGRSRFCLCLCFLWALLSSTWSSSNYIGMQWALSVAF